MPLKRRIPGYKRTGRGRRNTRGHTWMSENRQGKEKYLRAYLDAGKQAGKEKYPGAYLDAKEQAGKGEKP